MVSGRNERWALGMIRKGELWVCEAVSRIPRNLNDWAYMELFRNGRASGVF